MAMRRALKIALDAFWHFNVEDGWAIASHISLSALMSMFPFFIVLTALAGFVGEAGLFSTSDLADKVVKLLLATWPQEVAAPIAGEIHKVLTIPRGDVLTVGVLLAVYFASSGVESLRIGLNRAYGMSETRNWILLRLESIAYVLLGALALLALGLLIVLGPLLLAGVLKYAPWIIPPDAKFTFERYATASLVLVIALFVAHKWLPAGRRHLADILPGIVTTLVLWLVAGAAFGRYLAQFAFAYVSTYAGLASAMIALVFLYITASIFIYGGNLNAAILRARGKVS
jgi:membrane protein